MSIRLTNTGSRQRLAKSGVSYSDSVITIQHYVTSSGQLAPVYFNFRNQRPSLVSGYLPKTAQVGALVSEAHYYASIVVHLNKFSGMEVDVSFALLVPNVSHTVGVVDTLPLSWVVPSTEHLKEHVRGQVKAMLREWTEETSIWVCLNNWLKEQGYLTYEEE